MTATTKMPGHQQQLVPGANSNPVTLEGEAVMTRLPYESTTAEIIAFINEQMLAQNMDATTLAVAADMEDIDLLNILAQREILDVESMVKIATALGVEVKDLLPPTGTVSRAEEHPPAAVRSLSQALGTDVADMSVAEVDRIARQQGTKISTILREAGK